MKRFYLLCICILITAYSFGTKWEYHLSKVHTTDVVRGNKKIYFLSEGGIFYFDKTDSRILPYTKINGLSGSDFSGIEYSHATNSLIVFYKNSMVDVITDNDVVIPISAIKTKNISGNKAIYNATCYENLCYLSCGFGIVVLDLIKHEIKDTFIIGNNGGYEIVFDVAVDQENIYAGTTEGIKYARRDAPNLLDYSYWNFVDNRNVEKYSFNILASGFNRIWAVHQDSKIWHGDKIVSRHNEETWYYEYQDMKVVNSMKIEGDKIVFCGAGNDSKRRVNVYQAGVGLVESIQEYIFDDISETPFNSDTIEIDPRAAIVDVDGIIWIADYNYGAIRYQNGVFDIINSGGPVDNGAFALEFSNNKLWVASGGRESSWDNLWQHAVFQGYVSDENRWEAYNSYSYPVLADYRDVVQVLASPGNPNHIYVATWGGGILEFEDGKFIKAFDESNSTLENAAAGYYVRIGGMDFDDSGNLWVSNSEVENVIHMKKPDDTWKAFKYGDLSNDYKLGKVIVTRDDNIWTVVPRDKSGGLFVMSSDGRQKKSLNVASYFNNGDEEVITAMNDVYDIVEDREGDIWVGTSKGIAVYQRPEYVFNDDPFYAIQPGVDLHDGIYHPLLITQTITAIAVDGGNRKYCGTRNAGIFLVSPDGKEEIRHFTAEDDELISNGILSLEYDGKNGILYIGTELGLVSMTTESKDSYDDFSNVYAYPNPVREDYEGDIYISGLVEDTNIKITTVSGQLVTEFTSFGGQGVWDGRDMAGNRVHTGVYLVLCSSQDGSQSAVTKILFINHK